MAEGASDEPTGTAEASEAPTDMTKASVAPTDMAEASDEPTDMADASAAPTDMAEASAAPTDAAEASSGQPAACGRCTQLYLWYAWYCQHGGAATEEGEPAMAEADAEPEAPSAVADGAASLRVGERVEARFAEASRWRPADVLAIDGTRHRVCSYLWIPL